MNIKFYNNREDFLASLSGKSQEYIIRLNASMYTRYSIFFNKTKQRYRVHSHMDDVKQWKTEEELFNPQLTNFTKALENNALGKILPQEVTNVKTT